MMKRNILFNFLGRAWGVISVYLFIPLYLKFLGIDAYGLVGFYSTLLAVFSFADLGFTATLNREMARLSVKKDSAEEMGDLLRTYESTYLCISLFLAALCWTLSPLIAGKWLSSKILTQKEITEAIRLMGIAIAFQMPAGLYIGGLMGLQKQVWANSIQIAWGVFRGVGAVLVIWLFSPTIFAFALWQLISNAIYCFFARFFLWRALSLDKSRFHPRFTLQVFRNTWGYAAGMATSFFITIILSQTDKLVVSKMMPLDLLGYYTLAWALASAPTMLASPIAQAVFPRLTGLVEMNDRSGLTKLYHRTCELIAIAIIPAGLTLAFFSEDFIFAWTGSAATAHKSGLVASLLLAGQTIQALMVVPYYVALAHGNTRLNIFFGAISVLVITPLLIFLIMKFGLLGAGISWIVLNFCTLPSYMYVLHRWYFPGELHRWFTRSVAQPLIVSLPFVLMGYWLVPHTNSRFFTFGLIGLIWVITSTAPALISSEFRMEFNRIAKKLAGASYSI